MYVVVVLLPGMKGVSFLVYSSSIEGFIDRSNMFGKLKLKINFSRLPFFMNFKLN